MRESGEARTVAERKSMSDLRSERMVTLTVQLTSGSRRDLGEESAPDRGPGRGRSRATVPLAGFPALERQREGVL